MIFVCSSEMMVPHHFIPFKQTAKKPNNQSDITSHPSIFIFNHFTYMEKIYYEYVRTYMCIITTKSTYAYTYTHSHHSNQHQHQHDAYQKRKTAYLCIHLVYVSFRNNFGSTNIFHFSRIVNLLNT